MNKTKISFICASLISAVSFSYAGPDITVRNISDEEARLREGETISCKTKIEEKCVQYLKKNANTGEETIINIDDSDKEDADLTGDLVPASDVKRSQYLSRTSCLLDSACFINYLAKSGELDQIKEGVADHLNSKDTSPVKLTYNRYFQVPKTNNGGGIYDFMNKMYQSPVALSGVYKENGVDKKWCVWVYKPTIEDPKFVSIKDSFTRYTDDAINGFYYLHNNDQMVEHSKVSLPRTAYSLQMTDGGAKGPYLESYEGVSAFNQSNGIYRTDTRDPVISQLTQYPTFIDYGKSNGDCPDHSGTFAPQFTSSQDMLFFGNPTRVVRGQDLHPEVFLAEGIEDYYDKGFNDYADYYTAVGVNASSIKSSAINMTTQEYLKTLDGAVYQNKVKEPTVNTDGLTADQLNDRIVDNLKISYSINDERDVSVINPAAVSAYKEIDAKRFSLENALRYYYSIGKFGEKANTTEPRNRPIFVKGYVDPVRLYDPNTDSKLNQCAKRFGLSALATGAALNVADKNLLECLIYDPAEAGSSSVGVQSLPPSHSSVAANANNYPYLTKGPFSLTLFSYYIPSQNITRVSVLYSDIAGEDRQKHYYKDFVGFKNEATLDVFVADSYVFKKYHTPSPIALGNPGCVKTSRPSDRDESYNCPQPKQNYRITVKTYPDIPSMSSFTESGIMRETDPKIRYFSFKRWLSPTRKWWERKNVLSLDRQVFPIYIAPAREDCSAKRAYRETRKDNFVEEANAVINYTPTEYLSTIMFNSRNYYYVPYCTRHGNKSSSSVFAYAQMNFNFSIK